MGFERRDFDVGLNVEVVSSAEGGEENGSAGGDVAGMGGVMCDEVSETVVDRNSHLVRLGSVEECVCM